MKEVEAQSRGGWGLLGPPAWEQLAGHQHPGVLPPAHSYPVPAGLQWGGDHLQGRLAEGSLRQGRPQGELQPLWTAWGWTREVGRLTSVRMVRLPWLGQVFT